MEIMIYNKIISEFMGDSSTNSQLKYDTGGLTYVETPRTEWHYHENWNWLMPVVEKIESIYDQHHGFFGVHISSNSCTIQGTRFRSDSISTPPIYFDDTTFGSKLESTYNCVVNFIKWYNENKN